MNDRDVGRLWPTFAFRAWLAAVLAQTRRLGERLEARIGWHEQIISRLREKVQRSHTVAHSLEEALGTVDNLLRRVRDSEILEQHHRESEEVREGGAENEKPTGHHKPGRSTSRGGAGRS